MMKNKTLEKSTETDTYANGSTNGAHEVEVTIGEVRQGKPRAVAMDELDWEFLDFTEPSVPTINIKARITSLSQGEPDVTEVDEVDLDLIGSDSLEALSPLASYDAILEFEGKVTQGQFAPVDLDEVDLEIFN